MAELAGLNVKVGADISGLLDRMNRSGKSLQDFKDQLGRFKSQLDKSTDPASILRLNKAIESAQQKIKAIGNAGNDTGLSKVKKDSDTAGNSLMNLGRIAQDAPFGFVGISNNINPLLESFQRLQAESKATGTSLMSNLVGALSGGAGLGLAVSVATGLIAYFSMHMSKSKDESNKFAGSIRQITNEIDAANGRLKEMEKSTEFLQTLNDINLKINFSENQANDISASSASVSAMEKIVQLRKEEAIAYKRSGDAFELMQKNGSEDVNAMSDVLSITGDALEGLSKADKALVTTAQNARKNLSEIQQKVLDAENDSIVKQRSLVGLRAALAKKQADDAAKEANKQKTTVSSLLTDLDKEIKYLQVKGSSFFDIKKLFDNESQVKERVSAYKNTIEKIVRDFNLSPFDPIIVKLKTKIEIEENRAKLPEQIKTVVHKLLMNAPVTITAPIKPDLKLDETKLKKSVNDISDKANAIIQSTFTSTFSNIGEAIGSAMSGGNIGDIFSTFFSNIFKALGSGLKELGTYAIATSKLVLSLKATIGSGLGVAGGIAMIALGQIISAAADKIKLPGFANGVQNFAGGLAMVGERGPELVRLPGGSDVIPNHALGGMSLGGGSQVFIPAVTLRGKDLIVAFNRANQTINRQS